MDAEPPTAAWAVAPGPPAAGRGGAGDRVMVYELDPGEARQASALAAACAGRYGRVHEPRFVDAVSVAAHDLPRGVREAANRFRLADTAHALIIAGNLVDDDALGRTPEHWRAADTPGSRPHAFLLMLYAALLGDAVGWATQQAGRIVTDVLPIAGMEGSLVSSSSTTELGWHTEDAFSPYRADHVGLLCLRSPELTSTTIAHLDLAALPADAVGVLREPRFRVLPDSSHTAANGGQRPAPPPVGLIGGHPDAPVLRIDRDFTHALTGDHEALRALELLVAQLDRSLYDVALRPGDVCFVDNRNVVHGRRSFRPRYDGRDRWLKRVNVVADLRRTRPGRATAAGRVIG